MRLDLRDGLWVELRERITHAQDKEIKRAQMRARQAPAEAFSEGDTVALRVFIRAWSMADPDGNQVALTDTDAIDRMPADLADEVALAVNGLYHPVTVPNAPTPPSSDA